MASVHELLYASESLANIDLGKYIKRLMVGLSEMHKGRTNIEYKIDAEEIDVGIDRAVPCGIVLNELIANSFRHAFAENQSGEIKITARCANHEIEIAVIDDGQGMSYMSYGLSLIS